MPGNVHEVEVIAVSDLARAVKQIDLRASTPVNFKPGQFISLRVGEDADGGAILRSYSLASSPGESTLSLVIKRFEGGVASEWFGKLTPGTPIRFTGPMGFFVCDAQHSGDVLFAVTGVGITPVAPMLEEVLARVESSRVHLYWSLREPVDLFWQDRFAALARAHQRFTFHIHMTGDAKEWAGPRGRINAPILSLLPTLTSPTFYLIGNGKMIRELKAELIARGVDRKRQIRNEAFYD